MEYKGEYIGENGSRETVKGTLPEVSNWANNVVLVNGEGTILITKEKKND